MNYSWIPPLLALVLSPLLPGVINRTKAVVAGRRGQPILQLYFDLWKLLRKGAVYSRTTTWVFRAGPIISLAAVLVAITLLPMGKVPALLPFGGDLILFAYLLGLMRFVTVLAALDTGSSFEGMGASREVQFAALAEPALLLALAVLAKLTSTLSLSQIFGVLATTHWMLTGPVLALTAVTLLVVLLAENARLPVDDPNTHLELTMIHEVMVLDHSGPDFAFILYGAALKLWLLSVLLVDTVLPIGGAGVGANLVVTLGGLLAVGVVIGLIESTMARLRLLLVPQLLVGAGAMAAVALILVLR